jgi:hypothetical protein
MARKNCGLLRTTPLLSQEYVWCDLMLVVMVHATSLYGPRDTSDEAALSFLQANHPAILPAIIAIMMWTDPENSS